jgi:hypothetical protein
MNNWQIIKQLKYELGKRRWYGDAGNEPVFGSVKAVFSPPELLIQELRFPILFIIVQNADADSREPGLLVQNYDLRLVNMVRGDNVGEDAILGSNRVTAKSAGKGLLEIEEELHEIVRQMDENLGIKIIERFQSAGLVDEVAESGYVISRTYSIQIYCIDKRYYHPATRLTATGGAGQVVLTWELPPDRFDRYRVMLRRASGATPPATIADGTEVALGGLLATGVTNSGLTPGQYSYSLFAGYTEYGGTTPNKWSDKISKSDITVT